MKFQKYSVFYLTLLAVVSSGIFLFIGLFIGTITAQENFIFWWLGAFIVLSLLILLFQASVAYFHHSSLKNVPLPPPAPSPVLVPEATTSPEISISKAAKFLSPDEHSGYYLLLTVRNTDTAAYLCNSLTILSEPRNSDLEEVFNQAPAIQKFNQQQNPLAPSDYYSISIPLNFPKNGRSRRGEADSLPLNSNMKKWLPEHKIKVICSSSDNVLHQSNWFKLSELLPADEPETTENSAPSNEPN
jgi:hypothetical protein